MTGSGVCSAENAPQTPLPVIRSDFRRNYSEMERPPRTVTPGSG